MKTAKAVFAAILTLLITPSARAEWQFVQDWTDPINGFDTKAAMTTAADGTTLHLYRNPIGRVYALFTLPQDSGTLRPSGEVARLTPKGFDTKTIEARAEQGRVIEFATSTGSSLRDRLWHGEGAAPVGTLRDLIQAPSVTATFILAEGGEHNATWSMDDAGTPIAQALGISIEGAAAGDVWDDTAAQALLAAMTACQFPKLDVSCVQHVTTCSDKISIDRDIEGFETCVALDNAADP
ncbi:MAG: hypothetical protein AAGK77_00180 [Pseudomonadota bacterium]